MVEYKTIIEPKFWALKVFGFNRRAPFKVLMKSGTNFNYFTRTILNKMMSRYFCASKGSILVIYTNGCDSYVRKL